MSKINLLKYGKLIISPIISNLFSLFIETGVFPNCLKIADVIPIYKKGNQNMPTNYRPNSLSQFDKIFEKMLFSRLFSYFDKNQLLSKNQFGLRPNSSTQLAISTKHDKLIKNIDNGLYTCCIFLDHQKRLRRLIIRFCYGNCITILVLEAQLFTLWKVV